MNNREIDQNHSKKRNTLRYIGVPVLIIGVLLVIIGFTQFISPNSEFGEGFGKFALGLPFIFIGSVLTGYGYMGSVVRYQAGEMAPVAKDTVNYMVDGTKESIKTVAQSIHEGIHGDQGANVICSSCSTMNDKDSKFCKNCGANLIKEKVCSSCGNANDLDAKYCDNCGSRL